MRRLTMLGIFLLSLVVFSGPLSLAWAAADFSKVAEILDARGQMQEGAWVVRFPRSDLHVTINDEAMPTGLGFVSWAAFKDMGKKTMVMGDLVLLEEEVFPVISVLEANGLEITALHNHFLHEQPRIMFMHIEGLGFKENLATGLRQALNQTGPAKIAPVEAPAPGTTPAPAPAVAPETVAPPAPGVSPAPATQGTPAPGTAPAPAPAPGAAPAPTTQTPSAPTPAPAPGAGPAPTPATPSASPAPGAGSTPAPAPGAATEATPQPAQAPGGAPTPAPTPQAVPAPTPAPGPAPGAAPAPEGTPAAPPVAPTPAGEPLDTKRLEEIIGHPGQLNDEVFKITVGRKGFRMYNMALTSSLGLNSWVAFVGTSDRAHVAGDIVMTAKEVNRVIKALRDGGIEVVAVHNHMLTEQPRAFFLHYWGTGPAENLAMIVRAAFDEVKAPAR